MIDFSQLNPDDEQLRDYQLDNKRKIYKSWQRNRSVMLQMPTGTGKTRLFVSIVKDLHRWSVNNRKAVKTLILAHRHELIEQISDNVGYHYGLAHGVIMSKYWQQEKMPTQVASVQTLVRRLEKWKEKGFDLIIVDEAHHALADTYIKIIKTFPDAKVLGVTATPYRMNRASFKPVFDELITSPSVADFIKRGYLSEYEYYSVKPNSYIQQLIDSIDELAFDGDYAESALTRIFDTVKIRAKVVETYLKYAKGKKGIVYTIDIQHNKHVCEEFRKAGFKAEAIDSLTPKGRRDELVSDFRKGNIDILCNVNIFSEGFDCPDVEFIQLTRPTQSLSMYLQQVGRGFRINEGKEKVLFLDNVGLYNRFGLPSIRRQWNRYFEGINFDEAEENAYQSNSIGEKLIVRYIEEGNEELGLIFKTNIVTKKKIQFDEITDFPVLIARNPDWVKAFMGIEGVEFDEDDFESIVEDHIPDNDDGLLSVWGYNVNLSFQKVRINDKWGIFDSISETMVVPAIYDEINRHDKFQRSKIRKEDKWGILDCNNWEVKIPVTYDSIEKVYTSNFFIVEVNEKFGVVDFDNKPLIPFVYDHIWEMENKSGIHYNVIENETWKLYKENFTLIRYINKNSIQLTDKHFQADYKGIFAIVDVDNNIIAPCVFSKIKKSGIPELPLFVEIHGKVWGVLNDDLEWVLMPKFYHISIIKSGILKVSNSSGYGLMRYDGSFIVPCQYNDISLFKGYYLVYLANEKKWKVIDSSGNLINIEAPKKNECQILLCESLKIENPDSESVKTNNKAKKPKKIKGGNPKSTHKPVLVLKNIKQKEKALLLLSIIKLIEKGELKTPKIHLTEALVWQFNYYFSYFGLKSVRPEFDFGAAFYYLKDEDFWQLIPNDGKSVEVSTAGGNPFSISKMRERFRYAEIKQEFFSQLTDVHKRSKLSSFLHTLL